MEEVKTNESKSFLDQVEETEKEKKYSIPAKRLLEKLEPIPSKVESLKNRWFWELVQNASDFNSEVSVEVELNTSTLVFRHNGNPFKIVDVENLITPDSDKDDEEINKDYIGRFGSGFISTHVISSLIKVEGVVQDKYRENIHYSFMIELDRSEYQSKNKLIDSIERSEKQLKANYSQCTHAPGSFETIFTYDLSKSLAEIVPKEVVAEGLEFVSEVIPYVLTFLPKLKSVKLIDNINAKTQYFFSKSLNEAEGISVLGYKLNDIDQADVIVRFEKESAVSVATIVKDNSVVGYGEDKPMLFLSLPMIGTERFPFTIPLNSPKFSPETERNGINISNHDTSNRESLLSGVQAYRKLLSRLANDKVDGLYNLVKLKSERIKALSSDITWYQQNIEKDIRSTLEEIKLVNCNGTFVSYNELKLPFIPDNKSETRDLEYYDVISELIRDVTPGREEFLNWLKSIDFTIFKNVPFRLVDAVRKVESTGNLTALSSVLDKDLKQTETWLANFIKYVLSKETGLLTNHKIIPTKSETGVFVNRDAEVYVDKNIDESLIQVYNKMKGVLYQDKLLNDLISIEVPQLLPPNKIKNRSIIAKEIDDVFRLRLEGNSRLSSDELEGLNLLLTWLKSKGFPHWKELSHYFPTFHSSYSNFFMESFNEEERLNAISIRNSGKQDALVKLANSDISDADLNRVSNSINEVKKIIDVIDTGANIEEIAGLAKLFPEGIPGRVLDFAKEEARNKREFNNLLEVGSKVERLFIETLEGLDISSDRNKIIHAGGGAYDIRVYNPVMDRSFYIELKSCRNQNVEPINIAISQAKRAVKELPNENFAIVIIERNADNEMDIEYIKSNVQYFKNPGEYLSPIVENYSTIESKSNTTEKVDLKMDYAQFKGALDYGWVKEKVAGRGFNELITDIKRIIS